MFEDVHKPSKWEVSRVLWKDDHYQYDRDLYELGKDHPYSLVLNPDIEDETLIHFAEEVEYSDKCIVFFYDGVWVAKLFPQDWEADWNAYVEVEIVKPKFVWTKNPDLDKLMTFQDDPFGSFSPGPWDSRYKLVWYMDPRVNPTGDKVWALSCSPLGKEVLGVKDMGYVMPDIDVDYSEHLPDLGIDIDQCYPAFWELDHELAWELDPIHREDEQMWVVKFCPNYRKPKGWKWYGTITPQLHVEYNPNLPNLEYDLDYVIPWHDLAYEHVWMLDNKHLKNGEEEIWAFKIRVTNDVVGTSIVDYISPVTKIIFNEDLPQLKYDVDYVIPWYDLAYEHVWMLDNKHLKNGEEEIWAFKIQATDDIVGTSIIDYISPKIKVTLNKDLPKLNYNLDYIIPWHDLAYEHVWMLDNQRLKHGEEEIWAVKLSTVKNPIGTKFIDFIDPTPNVEINPALKGYEFDTDYITPWYDLGYEHIWLIDPKFYSEQGDVFAVRKKYVDKVVGTKNMGILSPQQTLEFNPALKNLYIEIDYNIPFYDVSYEHVWYVEVDGEKIWSAKLRTDNNTVATKDMGIVQPMIPKQLDVVFISYKEPNAEENWNRLLEFVPNAKRVQGVQGILAAHKAAANLVTTDMFYVVDGDAWINDGWTFDFQPNLYDRDCVYVWHSKNPVNDLHYGYGGVKLFPTALLKRTSRWGTDLTTSVGKKLKVIEQVSNVTKFNASEFDTWRSAFRECAKLAVSIDNDAQSRLAQWLASSSGEFADWAQRGAQQGKQYAETNPSISRINDYGWLEQQFKELNE
jgi:hypothetical protein